MKQPIKFKEHKKATIVIIVIAIIAIVAACFVISTNFSKSKTSKKKTNVQSTKTDGIEDAPTSGLYWKNGTEEIICAKDEATTLEIAANDQATKDNLSKITWSIDGTDIKGTGSTVKFKASINVGQYIINAVLDDGKNKTTLKKTLTVIN